MSDNADQFVTIHLVNGEKHVAYGDPEIIYGRLFAAQEITCGRNHQPVANVSGALVVYVLRVPVHTSIVALTYEDEVGA